MTDKYKIGIFFLFPIAGYLLQTLLNIFFANHLTPDLYGNLVIALATINIGSSILILGTDSSSKKFLPKFIAEDKKAQYNNFITWSIKFFLKSTRIFIIIFSVLIGAIFIFHYLNIKIITTYHISIFMLILCPIYGLVLLIASYLSSHNKVINALVFIRLLNYLLPLLFFFFAIMIFKININTLSLISIYIFAYIILLISIVTYYNKYTTIPPIPINAFKDTQYDITNTNVWKSTSLNLLISGILYLIFRTLDLYIIEFVAPNEHDVGHYAACITIIGIIFTISELNYGLIKPKISALITSTEGQIKLQKLFNKFTIIGLVIIITLILIIIYFRYTLLSWFGESYTNAATTLIVLCVNAIIGFLLQPVSYILIYSGYEKFAKNVRFVSIILLLIIGPIMTYFYNITGIALANIFVYGYLFIAQYMKVKHNFKNIKPLVFL